MAQYDNTNRGSLGKNKNKTSDKHPDYKGKLNIDGREYWLSGWVKETNGDKWVSLSVQEKEQKQDHSAPAREYKEEAMSDDSLPF